MQILIQYLKNTNVPLEQKIRYYESLKEPGIGVPIHHVNEVCQIVKNFLTNGARRWEGLIFLDLVMDKIPDQVLNDHLVFFVKQIIGMCANDNHAETCFGLLNRLILRGKSMQYILRDMRCEVLSQLMQLVTRELAKVPVSRALLLLTQAVLSLFAKSCGPNREPMERFLFKQIVQAELFNPATCDALAQTAATLPKCVADADTRHHVHTSYLEMMIRSSQLTEKLYSQPNEPLGDEALRGTIYEAAGESAVPQGVDQLQAKLVVWRRLLLQLDVIGALIESPLSKSVSTESLFKLLNTVLVSGGRDEHLSFLHPSLILTTMSVVRKLLRRFGDQLLLKNTLLIPFFMHSLDLTLQSGTVDLSFTRLTIYEAMAEWLTNSPPSTFGRKRHEALAKLVKISCEDVTRPDSPTSGPNRTALVSSALALQRAIILTYGHRDEDHVRQCILQLLPYAVELSSPFKGVFRTNATCRCRVYELLAAFSMNSNATLMPPTGEINKLIAEGMFDDDHHVRGVCKMLHKIIEGIINPIECGFSKSYSHALHEHNREAQRLHLTRAKRSKTAETQTTENSQRSAETCEKGTNTETMPTPRQTQIAAWRAVARPCPKSQKRKLTEEALPTRRVVTSSAELDEDDDIIDEEPEDVDDDDDDVEGEDEDEEEFDEMEFDEAMFEEQNLRQRPKIPIRKGAYDNEAAVIIADDDDDEVVITNQGPSSSREQDVVEDDGCEVEEEEEEEPTPEVAAAEKRAARVDHPNVETAEIHPLTAVLPVASARANLIEDVDEDQEDDDDDDMCVITDGPMPARARPKKVVLGPNGTDPFIENQSPAEVLAVLTPVEDSRENGDERTKDIVSPSRTNGSNCGSTAAKALACTEEVTMEAVLITIGSDTNEITDELKKKDEPATVTVEPIKAETTERAAV